jgi:hypothetical protein
MWGGFVGEDVAGCGGWAGVWRGVAGVWRGCGGGVAGVWRGCGGVWRGCGGRGMTDMLAIRQL